jgi:hypothetical protein
MLSSRWSADSLTTSQNDTDIPSKLLDRHFAVSAALWAVMACAPQAA